MYIELIKYTPEPEKTVAIAARVCYSPRNAKEIYENMSDEEVKKLIRFLIKAGHHSAIEHASFTFIVDGISRACSHQLVRHRLASYSQQSQRYVEYKRNLEYIIPQSIKDKKDLSQKFEEFQQQSFNLYKYFLKNKISSEDARYVLSNAFPTQIIITMNARELLHLFTLRCCERAQWEIREMAYRMLNKVKKVAPTIFEHAGPSCFRGRCPEGEMMCKNPPKEDEILEKYLS
ncbi:MAG: FAD-dependent thymidylate synthase [Candidatus Humimicrobiia bacterium]